MPRFAANLGYLFTEHAMIDRVGAAAAAGFKAIELQFPYDVPAAQMKAAIDGNKLTVLGINTLRGGGADEFGLAAVPGREKEWEMLFGKALDYISAVGGSAVHCLAGKVDPSQRPAAERVYVANLVRAADLAAARNVTLLIEPINPRDRPNYFLNHVEHAADIIAKAGKPNIKIQFDFYHVQIVGGDLLYRLEKYLPAIGHLQCAAVPVRHEPEGGEVNFPAVFEAVDRLGYKGWIGAEYRPRGRTEDGLGWARPYGIVPKN
ncbi:MAG: TIM barrel protein [Pseudolabrys sp.]